ncbi:MAG TPA: metal ABC transporter substrate-binding protein, partial [Thermoleophilia bacterium]
MRARRASRSVRARVLCAALCVIAGATALGVGGCGAGVAAHGGTLDVVATESFLADIAQNVAGNRFTVRTLIPPGADPHAFEPTPKDVAAVAGADLVIINGGGLEGPLLGTLKNAGGSAAIVAASAGLKTRTPQPGEPPLAAGQTDPHFWLDPVLVETYVTNIRDALVKADPAGTTVYKANAAAYTAKLRRLNAWIKAQVAQLPEQDRKLVLNHASHGYFADRYGFQVVGTVIPSVGTSESPTARQLAALTAAIRKSGARAIFVEKDENPQLAEQVAAETGIKVVTDLLDHSLTPAGGAA